ncbi:MAG TPA: ATP-binding protein [Acidobacteriaceae bacterium]|jgi:nitrogen fixation/metabolism regulation signal transduction histidine kinase|nr:ATP-binding protein [Acidobacteriaceae bacterium]
MANHQQRRKPKRQSVSFEARLRIFSTIAALCVMGLCAAVLALLHVSAGPMFATLGILLLVLLLVFAAFIEAAVRPIQTLANVVAALREEDYSFRARGANRDDSLGQLSLEINALADTLQAQRVGALEAVALLRRVIAEMDAPVLAFDQDARLRLLNPAAERAFALEPARDLGKSAADLSLDGLLDHPSETMLPAEAQTRLRHAPVRPGSENPRWMIRRGSFRQRGVPHTLVVLSDVSTALRDEERLAWRRLIRVIGHEISNSLTPIKSIAGSLRSRLHPSPANGSESSPATQPAPPTASARTFDRDLNRGLSVIENRADSLNRFVQAYRQLAQLPAPILKRVPLVQLLERVVSLEIRLDVRILGAPDVDLLADPDQIEQLLINLLRNAVEAANTCAGEDPEIALLAEPCSPEVTLRATDDGDLVSIQIEDNGPGLANPENLFVPLYTTKKSGSGVGLALARQIVEAHGGAITLRNRPGKAGCLAEVRIPIAERTRPTP